MARVVLAFSISLDGYVAGPGIGCTAAYGRRWRRPARLAVRNESGASEIDLMIARELKGRADAVVLGRRAYDLGLAHRGDTPYPVPSFVLTHRDHPPRAMTSAAFTFITGGVASAIEQARAEAGEKGIIVMGPIRRGSVLAAVGPMSSFCSWFPSCSAAETSYSCHSRQAARHLQSSAPGIRRM